jgi:hypothetical protein
LGILDVIDEALNIDLSGSTILEFLLRAQAKALPGFDIGVKETIGVPCWYLWWIRRQRTHDESVPPLSKCKMSILSIVANAAKVNSKGGVARQRWCKPNPRHLKINVDGSFHSDSHARSIGAVVRDYKGEFIAASTVFLPHVLSPTVVEAMAMREGLSLANHMGCTNVIMDSDSSETVDACNGIEAWWGESAAILTDCVDLASLLNSVSFQ